VSPRPFSARLGRALMQLPRVMPHPRVHSFNTAPYRGATIGKGNQDWIPGTMSGDLEAREGLKIVRNRGRDLARNNPYAGSFLRLGRINVVSPYGFTVRPQVRDANDALNAPVNTALRKYFSRFACGRVTLARDSNLARALGDAWETAFKDGECFIRMIYGARNPWGLALQFIDADLIDEYYNRPAGPGQNEIRMGAEIDDVGAVVGWWVNRPESEFGWPVGERYYVPAFDPYTGRGEMLHYFLPSRVNQTRGVSRFNPVMETLNQLGALEEAELYASRMGASSLGFIIPGEHAEEPEDEEQQEESAEGGAAVDGEPAPARAQITNPQEIQADPGAWYRLHRGESIAQWRSEHPNTALPEVLKLFLQAASVGLGGLYYEIAGDLEGVNFTSSRAGQLSQRDVWRLEQEALIDQVVLPIYLTCIRLALFRGAITVKGRRLGFTTTPYADVDIRGRGWEFVQPNEELQARALALTCGLTSRHRILAELNEDWDETREELKSEQRDAERDGISITPPGSVAANVAATVAVNREEAAADEKTPPGAKKNGNGANGSPNGNHEPPSVSNQAPRVGASRF
jgi:lambda family phage portal protein